jgi:hypothetical protein
MIASLSYDNEIESEQYSSTNEVIDRLRVIHQRQASDRNIVVIVTKENGEILGITLGSNRSMLDWFPKDYANTGTGSFHSLHEAFGDSDEGIYDQNLNEVQVFFFYGHYSECFIKHTVNIELAFRVMAEFLESDGLPTLIKWEID